MKKNSGGFVLLEVMTIMMLVLVFSSALYGMSGAKYRRTLERVQEDEAYYTALTAVRLMAREVVEYEGDEDFVFRELTAKTGMKRQMTELLFESDEGEDTVAMPIKVWSKWEDETLVLSAQAERGRKMCQVRLKLRMETLDDEVHWIPITYEVER